MTRTNGPWPHTSDDSYMYKLSLVVAIASISFVRFSFGLLSTCVTTGWIFEISLCVNSTNQSIKVVFCRVRVLSVGMSFITEVTELSGKGMKVVQK